MRTIWLTGFIAASLTACSLYSGEEKTSLKAPETAPDGGCGGEFPLDGGAPDHDGGGVIEDAAWLPDGGGTWPTDGGFPDTDGGDWHPDGGQYGGDGGDWSPDGGLDHPPDGAWPSDGGVDQPVDAGAPHPH